MAPKDRANHEYKDSEHISTSNLKGGLPAVARLSNVSNPLMTLGNRLGWGLTKISMFSPVSVLMVTSIVWGILIAAVYRLLIGWQDPNLILKIIMGYGAGAHASLLGYGLWAGGNGPNKNQDTIFSAVPLITYVLASIVFAFI